MATQRDVNLIRRAYASPPVHRLAPWPIARATVQVRAERLWRDPARRAHAHLSMEYLLGRSGHDVDLDVVARRFHFQTIRRDELTWRPWQTTRLEVEGSDVLHELTGQGRGAIVSFFHHGQYAGIFGSLARRGIHLHIAVLPSLLGPQEPTYEGMRRRQHIATATTGGATVFAAKGGYGEMLEMVERGKLVAIASDIPGSLEMTMLGRRVSAASGPARLAADTGALIVPVTSRPHGLLQTVRVEDPIDPRDHADLASIQQAIADAHAPALLEWPDGLMDPLERWRAVDEADIARFGLAVAPT